MPTFVRNKFLKYLLIVSKLVVFSSCATIGLNMLHKTPKKAAKIPTFNACDSLRGVLNPFRECYDVYYYALDIEFNLDKKSIHGSVGFWYTVVKDFDLLQIDLYENMIIDSIVSANVQCQFNRKCNAVFVTLPQNSLIAEKGFFKVYYHGIPLEAKRPPWEGGFVWAKDKDNNPWNAVTCEVAGASLWWPVKDHLSDEPDSMQMTYTVPEGLKCIGNGVLTDSVTRKGLSSYTWKVHYPINTYNVTFYVGNFEHFAISYTSKFEPFKLEFYVLPYNSEKAKDHFLQVPDIIRFYEKSFGPYPWPKDGFKLIESPFAGMEHQSAIAYGNGFKNHYNFGFDYIILHEAAHEWWGNSVSVPDYAEIWIHEGFATYSEAMYIENLYGYEKYLSYLRVYAILIKNKRPVVGPHDVNFWDYKDADVYMKGALVLHTLRNSLRNDTLFFEIISGFYQKFAHKTAVTKDFIDFVNEKTQKDYTAFFEQYLYNRTCPELEWEFFFNKEKQKNEIYYRWSNAVDSFSIPIKVKTGTRTFVIKPTNKLQKSELPTEKSVIINPEGSYIASKRTHKFK